MLDMKQEVYSGNRTDIGGNRTDLGGSVVVVDPSKTNTKDLENEL